MTSPFDKRSLGKRAAGPQFPQRRALRRKDGGKIVVDNQGRRVISVEQAEREAQEYDQRKGRFSIDSTPIGKSMHPFVKFKKGGKIPKYFIGGLFSGTPGSSTTNQSGSSSTSVNNPIYNDLRDTVVGQARHVVDMPYNPYTGEAVAPLSADQNTAFGNIRTNQGNYKPYFQNASTSLNNVAALSPTGAGQGYIDQAGGMETGAQAASPFVQKASQTFPGAVQDYMSPYVDQVNNRIADLGARNLNEKLLPGINDTFSGGTAAQFGRNRHADVAGRALRDTQESVLGQQSVNLNNAYSTAGNLFNQDANRAANMAATTGTLAQNDRTGTASIGTAAGNLANQGVSAGINTANAQTSLGQATQAAAGTDANALATSGGIQRDVRQQQNAFDYSQWQAKENNTVNRLQQAQSLAQGWTLPMNSSYQSQGTTTTVQPQGSPFGQIMGAGMGLASLAIPGAGGASALGNVFGKNGLGWLGGGGGNSGPSSGSVGVQDGGYIKRAVGGMVPTVRQMRLRNAPQQAPQGPGMMPTGMPGMPPMAPPNPMARQPNGQVASPFARGGAVPGHYEEGGDILHGILGTAGSLLGNLIPIPGVGPAIGKFLGHTGANLISGQTDDIDNDAAEDFTDPLPFGLGRMISGGMTGPRPTTSGDQIESMAGPFGNMGMSMMRRGGRYCGPDNDWKVQRGPITARFANGGYSPFLASSEGLDGRLEAMREWEANRPRPFGPGEQSDMNAPTGREAQYHGWGPQDVFQRLFNSMPPQARENVEFLREWAPDRAIGSANSRMTDALRAIYEGRPGDAAEGAGLSLIDAATTAIPAMKGARSLMRPAGEWLARQLVR